MKESIFFKQEKPLTVWILGSFLLLLTVYFLLYEEAPLSQIIVMTLLSLVLLGYSTSLEVSSDFRSVKHIKFFGVSLTRTKINMIIPEYIGLFSARYKQGSEWGSVAAMGRERAGHRWVIRLFKRNKHFTLYRSRSFSMAKQKATALSTLLNVELRVKE